MATDLFCLFNIKSGLQLVGVSEGEIRILFMVLPKSARQDWFYWSPNESGWQPLEQNPRLLKGVKRPMPNPPPPPEDSEVEIIKNLLVSHRLDDVDQPRRVILLRDIPDVEVEREGEYISRAFRRYHKRFRLEIECNGQKFITHSADISIGGVRVVDPLPEWLVGYCSCDLVNESTNEVAELTCAVVENQELGQRFRLEFGRITNHEHQDQLEAWFVAAA